MCDKKVLDPKSKSSSFTVPYKQMFYILSWIDLLLSHITKQVIVIWKKTDIFDIIWFLKKSVTSILKFELVLLSWANAIISNIM